MMPVRHFNHAFLALLALLALSGCSSDSSVTGTLTSRAKPVVDISDLNLNEGASDEA